MDDELNWAGCRALNVAVCRRITGGGAVYHDRGNVNYTIACRGGDLPFPSDLIEKFRYFTCPIVSAAENLGRKPRFVPPNSVADEDGAKFSGSAALIRSGSLLFHASVLVSSDLGVLRRVLSDSPNLNSKTVQSRRATICNLNQAHAQVAIDEFERELTNCIERDLGIGLQEAQLSRIEASMVLELRNGKYSSAEWFRPAS